MTVITAWLNHSSEPFLRSVTYQPELMMGTFTGRIVGARISVLQFKVNGERGNEGIPIPFREDEQFSTMLTIVFSVLEKYNKMSIGH